MKRKMTTGIMLLFLSSILSMALNSIPVSANGVKVSIDIKPGSCPNSINPNSKGVVPVAIKTTPAFDATTVDPTSVLFAGAFPLRWAMEDVDGDGDTDLIFHFKTQELDWISIEADPQNRAYLTGKTYGGQDIWGQGWVNIVPKGK